MIKMSEYKVKFYKNSNDGNEPVFEYIKKLDHKNKAKVLKYNEIYKAGNNYDDVINNKFLYE